MTEQELASVIWDIKEIIRGLYDDAEVEDVILPFTLLRRLDCVLDEKRDAIMEELSKIPTDAPEKMKKIKLDSILRRNNLTFFNVSGLSMEKMLAAPAQIATSFDYYLNSFTDNVRDILANFVHKQDAGDHLDLSDIYRRLAESNKLFSVCQMFVQRADLHPDKMSNAMMGTVFENVIRRSKESSNTKAGQFYTPRDIVQLLVALTISGHEDELYIPGRIFSIYDPCCGTGGMLTEGKAYLQRLAHNPDLKVQLFGQELNDKTYAICKADLLMKGDDHNISQQLFKGNTFSEDRLYGRTFNFMLANPPFGVDWGKDEYVKKCVQNDNAPGRRFEAGLPTTSDGSLLFLMHMVAKMDQENGSRIGIVLNGSPLFNGDAGSGWSNIRKMLLDRNLLDCIVSLPGDLFYGTGISTYLWILDNKRPVEKQGKVLFIDASHKHEYAKLLQTNLGKKRYDISEEGAKNILDIYREYQSVSCDILNENTGEVEHLETAKKLDYDDFLYTKVAVRRPMRYWFEGITSKYEQMKAEEGFKPDDKKNLIYKNVAAIDGIDKRRSDTEFFAFLKSKKCKPSAAEIKNIRKAWGSMSEDAPEVLNNPYKADSGFLEDGNLTTPRTFPLSRTSTSTLNVRCCPSLPMRGWTAVKIR
ncbi:class I SAM-dependent DNA methyltransferase [Prevotella melaninogenica]|uniref:class I SAM-dependent DNA methyltransferase n=1 Tax=Prevotella melaninogenica TaxID=28132 RepID=UPI0001AEA7F5|nr:class I SAM-dependent DNA methyltransferase [Prevotella melaninogenica]UEB08447.1 type I restriction-modification system subunit M [Prevotella melaninogenica]